MDTTPKQITELLDEMDGGTLARTVGRTFADMDVAEREIEAAKARHPDAAGAIGASFLLLCPTLNQRVPRLTARLYPIHCRELLDRVARGEDVNPATDAELIMALAETSQAAPLTHDAAMAYAKLFERHFPDVLGDGAVPQEAIDYSQAALFIAEMRSALSCDRARQ